MPSLIVDTSTPALVTGATGYVAGRVIERLLQDGVTVHGTVRDPSKRERLEALTALADASPGSLVLFAADLTKKGSFAEAMAGCGVVFHVASPFLRGSTDPENELVKPALEGTRTVLEQASLTPSVTRVVVTSSCVAIYGDCVELADTPNGVFTEDCWNTSSSLTYNAYAYSKTLAEREAWKIAEAQSQWRLVVVNPSLVMGPGIKIHASSESFNLMKQMGDGTFKSGTPDLRLGVVDVRDLADAHVRAGFVAEAEGRHIICGHCTSMPEMANALKPTYANYPLPNRVIPKFLLWVIGPFVNASLTRKFVSRNLGYPWKADTSKSREALGVSYRPLAETMTDFMAQLIEAGVLPKA